MFKKLTILMLAVASFCAPAMAETYKVGVSAEPYPPFYTPDADGKWSGWEIDLMNEICTRIKAECVVTPIAWDGIIPALKTGKIDMIIGSMSITPARAKQINFSDKYYATPTGLLVAKGTKYVPTPEGIAGAIVGAQSGAVQEAYANKHYADTAGDIRIYQTLDEELQDLAAGRLDAVVGDSLAMSEFIDSAEGQACCEYKGSVIEDPEVLGHGVGAGLRKEDADLLAQVNAAIAEIRSDGTYEKISKPYFKFDIYGQ
ncbi:transporter substrate-binding domain-containing protein [Roseibium algae]|uniref:Transporter substrate-binding domain-containing protein n=1 Tax=Roseibium algae TaxID=3123038 RepID=A0ABU8THZ7_9HYPH